MKKQPNTYTISLIRRFPHKDNHYQYYMDGDELFSATRDITFQAVDISHALLLIKGTYYANNIRRCRLLSE